MVRVDVDAQFGGEKSRVSRVGRQDGHVKMNSVHLVL